MYRTTILALSLLFVAAAGSVAAPLKIVTVAAPDINCKFDTDCKITVNDSAAHFTLPTTTGDAFLQSRTWPKGQAGTAGAGKFAYLYRLDLRNLTGVTAPGCISQLRIPFGPVTPLDYNGDGKPDHVFVITKGGLGNVAPSSASLTGSLLTFNFSPAVCSGSSPGKGDSSFFFGLASTKAAKAVTAVAVPVPATGNLNLDARAPNVP